MLKKRLIGVVTVKDGWAVQSFGYSRYLPLGKPRCAVENLDRWGADEILVQVIDRSAGKMGPDFALLEELGQIGLKTPLIYAGGVRSVADGVRLVQLGADRLVVDALLVDDPITVEALAIQLGAQAIIGCLPLACRDGDIALFDYRSRQLRPIPTDVPVLIESGKISELMIVDFTHEGIPCGFDTRLIDKLTWKQISLIAFGGISKPEVIGKLLQRSAVSAVAIGNFLSYREHAIQFYRSAIGGSPIRSPEYLSSGSNGNWL